MSDFLERLRTEVLIGTGPAQGTMLMERGWDPSTNGVEWVFNHPNIYQDILRAFFDAGSDFACTFGLSKLSLKQHCLRYDIREINSSLVTISKEAIPQNCYFVWQITSLPTGQFLKPFGDISFDEFYESVAEQVIIVKDMGVDLFRCCCSGIEEMKAAIKAVKENSRLPVLGTAIFTSTLKGFRTMDGVDPATEAETYQELGTDIIGFTCGDISYDEAPMVLREMAGASDGPLAARPNAGMPKLIEGKAVYPATPEHMAKAAPKWVEAGARVIWGCCGTTPAHLARVVAGLKKGSSPY